MMARTLRFYRSWWPSWIVLGLGVFILLGGPDQAGRIEGTLWPVVTDVTIGITDAPDDVTTIVAGSFVKARDCAFTGIEFHLVTPTGSVPVAVRFLDQAAVRAPGRQSFGPWRVDIDAARFGTSVAATVTHRCHALWPTITHFYPPELARGGET